MLRKLLVLIPLITFSLPARAALTITYKDVPDSVHQLVDFEYIGGSREFQLKASDFTEKTAAFDPDWSKAIYRFNQDGGFLEVPLPNGALTREVRVVDGGSEPFSEMGRAAVILVASPLKISGPFPFLREMVRAGQAGRSLRCTIRPWNFRITVTLLAGGEFRGSVQEPVFLAGEKVGNGVAQPSECQIDIQ